MDVTMLANELVEALAPFLPFLTQLGKETAEGAGRQFGADAWDYARSLWEQLGGRLQERPAALEAVRDTAEAPDDGDARAALRLQIRKLLADDEALAGELGGLLEQRRDRTGTMVNVTASGRSVAIGRDATGNRIVTGDQTPDPN